MLLIAGCSTTVYHKKHGRVNTSHKYLRIDSKVCMDKVTREKKYRNSAEFQNRLGVCMIEKGWRP